MAPPFRADHVGSLLRPADVKDARAKFNAGNIDADELKSITEAAIERAVARQEDLGLRGVTDGEYRRAFFNYDFAEHIGGVEASDVPGGFKFGDSVARARVLNVTGKIRFDGHPMLDEFKFLKAHAGRTAKWTIPSPSVFHFRFGRNFVSKDAYPDMEEFFHDVEIAFRDAVRAFAEAGCEYLQIDECPIIFLCDPAQRKTLEDRGDDPDEALKIYARMLNTAVSGAPDGMTTAVHLCRGNYRSTFATSGGYEPVAELLFGGVAADAFFLEYDSDRAGDFSPLRHVRPETNIVLGVITSKTAELEDKDGIKRRIDEASQFVPMERLCLSPQCGFASTEEGNELTEDEQWAKLAHVVDIARDVWGEV